MTKGSPLSPRESEKKILEWLRKLMINLTCNEKDSDEYIFKFFSLAYGNEEILNVQTELFLHDNDIVTD